MRLLSTFRETFVRAALCTRATLVSFPYHVRHFCGAHTPIFYSRTPRLPPSIHPNPLLTYPFFLPYRVSTIARAPALGYLLFAGTFVRRFDHHHYSSGTRAYRETRRKRPRDDTALLHARVHFVDKSTRVVSAETLKIVALRLARKSPRVSLPRVVIVENSPPSRCYADLPFFFREKKKPVRLVVSDSNISRLLSSDSFPDGRARAYEKRVTHLTSDPSVVYAPVHCT